MIQLTDVQFCVKKKEILKDITLNIKPGEKVAILGPNGCGKTTLVNIITANIQATAGNVERGQLERLDKTKVCYMMQHETLNKSIKVKEAIELFSKNKNNEYGQKLLNQFGIQHKANSYYRSLSGGEKQKLSLICSLQNQPTYFFVDEVTTGLDALSRNQLMDYFVDVVDETKTFVMVTHYLEEAEKACDRFIFMKDGRIAYDMQKSEMNVSGKSTFTLKDGTTIHVDQAEAESYMQSHFSEIATYEAKQTETLEALFQTIYGEEVLRNEHA